MWLWDYDICQSLVLWIDRMQETWLLSSRYNTVGYHICAGQINTLITCLQHVNGCKTVLSARKTCVLLTLENKIHVRDIIYVSWRCHYHNCVNCFVFFCTFCSHHLLDFMNIEKLRVIFCEIVFGISNLPKKIHISLLWVDYKCVMNFVLHFILENSGLIH